MRILVAEDDAVLAGGVMHTLRQSGHAVDWVKNGAEADCALAAGEFDLLILDLGLPKKSGLDVLRRLRSGDSRLPVLILTALTRRGMAGSPTLIHHGALKYDQIGRVASLNGAPLELSAREISLLEVFLQRAGANGARKSRPTRSRCTCIACARSSSPAACASSRSAGWATASRNPYNPRLPAAPAAR